MRKLILFTLIVLSCQVSSAQNIKQLYYGSDIIIEAPVSYSFKAGVENIRKTVTVKVIVPNFRVEYNDIAQYIEGGAMGGFKYDLSFTRWYKRGEITSIIVDGTTIPISEFTDNGNAGPIIFSDLSFFWFQKNYPVKRWSLGGLSFRAELDNAEKRIGLSTDYFELKDFLGTETNKEAENNLKANGEIFARDLVFGEVKYYPSPNIGSYLAKRDARIAEETGSYTVNGFTNKVKESATPVSSSSSNSGTGSTSNSGSGSTQTSSTTGSNQTTSTDTNTGSSQTSAQEQRKREEERQRKLEQSKKDLANAGASFATGIMNGSINVGLRMGGTEKDYKDTSYPLSLGIMFGYISGFGINESRKNAAMPIGFITHANMSKDHSLDSYDSDEYNFEGQIVSFGATFALGVFKINEFMPSIGAQWTQYSFYPGQQNFNQDSGFSEDKLAPTIGIMGKLANLFYSLDYNTHFKSYEFGLGLHFGKN